MKSPDAKTAAIVAAVRTGVAYRVIADVYGISRQRVGQIARKAGWEPERPANRRGKGRIHGRYGYEVLGCRCEVCRRASATHQREKRSRHG